MRCIQCKTNDYHFFKLALIVVSCPIWHTNIQSTQQKCSDFEGKINHSYVGNFIRPTNALAFLTDFHHLKLSKHFMIEIWKSTRNFLSCRILKKRKGKKPMSNTNLDTTKIQIHLYIILSLH